MNADWLEQARRLAESVGGLTGHPSGGVARDAPECRWCPLCQFLAVLRGERPEVTTALADVLTATADALRSFAAAPDARPAGQQDPAGAAEPSGGDPAPVVQRIEIA